jgi:hypothetical protein
MNDDPWRTSGNPPPPGSTKWNEMWADLERDQHWVATQPATIMTHTTDAKSPGPAPTKKDRWRSKFPEESRLLSEWTGTHLLKARVSGVWPITTNGSWILTNTKGMAERWGISRGIGTHGPQRRSNRGMRYAYAPRARRSPEPNAGEQTQVWETAESTVKIHSLLT